MLGGQESTCSVTISLSSWNITSTSRPRWLSFSPPSLSRSTPSFLGRHTSTLIESGGVGLLCSLPQGAHSVCSSLPVHCSAQAARAPQQRLLSCSCTWTASRWEFCQCPGLTQRRCSHCVSGISPWPLESSAIGFLTYAAENEQGAPSSG